MTDLEIKMAVRVWKRGKPYRRSVAEIKAVVRFRDGYRCRECGMTAKDHYRRFHRSLEVHRLIPGSRYSVRGCVTLCIPCHKTKPKSERNPAVIQTAVRLRERLAAQLELLADRDESNITELVNRAVREFLVHEGFWPPRTSTDD